MANSKITIIFNTLPVDYLYEKVSFGESLKGLIIENTFNNTKGLFPPYPIPIPVIPPFGLYFNGYISDFYKTYFDTNYNSSNYYTIVSTPGVVNSGLGVVEITANYVGAIFTKPVDLFGTKPSNYSGVTIIIENEVFIDPLVIDPPVVVPPVVVPPVVVPPVVVPPVINYTPLSISNPFLSGNINFTQELKYLSFNSKNAETYVKLTIEIKTFKLNSYEPIIYTRNYKLPLFQGKGEFHVGTIAHDLFEEIKELADFIPQLKQNYSRPQYRPSEITISFEEILFNTEVSINNSITLPMILMAKGFKPFITDNQTALLTIAQQEITRITPKSMIGTSFICYDVPRVIVKKNEVIIEDITLPTSPGQIIYSYFRFINDLKPGDSINIIVLNGDEARSQRFLVFPIGKESTYFFFETNNGILEPFEFTGRRRVVSNLKSVSSIKVKNLHSYESKDKSTNLQSFIVNTGQLTKTDHRMLTILSRSLKVWCCFDNPDGNYFRVDAITTKITNQDTDISEEGFDIEFNILEDANDSIYPH